MQFSLNIQTIANVTMVLNNSSTKKGHINWTFYILNVAYILKTMLSKLFVIFYNEIITVPMKSGTELVCVSKQQRCFISEGICSFEQLGESVINIPFITSAFCFEWTNEWSDGLLIKTVTYCHLLAILVLNLQVSLRFAIIYCFWHRSEFVAYM